MALRCEHHGPLRIIERFEQFEIDARKLGRQAGSGRHLATAAFVVLLLLTVAIYTSQLGSAPAYLAADETHFALHARSLAVNLTDLNGQRLPVFVRISDPLADIDHMNVWYQPSLFYLLGAVLRAAPFAEWSVRLPVALIGVVNVCLMFLVARRAFRSQTLGLVSSAVLALTPAHFLFSRMAADYLCPLPFVLAWLWFLLRYLDSRRAGDIAAAALFLGVGLFTYISSWLFMPLLALATAIAVRMPMRHLMGSAVAFAAPPLLILPMQSNLTTVFGDLLNRYGVVGRVAAAAPALDLRGQMALFWDYFNPSFLFFAGGSDLLMATSKAGVFLLPIAPLVVVGFVALAKRRSPDAWLILAGFVASPLPVVLMLPEAPGSSTGRILPMVVFGALIATAGVEELWRMSTRPARAMAIVLLAAMPVQFIAFRSDYFGDYQLRAWRRFDPNATRDVVRAVIELDRRAAVRLVLLNDDGDNKGIRWWFYATKYDRADLWERTRYFQIDKLAETSVPPGSLLLMQAADPRAATLETAGYSRLATIAAANGEPATIIFGRVQFP